MAPLCARHLADGFRRPVHFSPLTPAPVAEFFLCGFGMICCCNAWLAAIMAQMHNQIKKWVGPSITAVAVLLLLKSIDRFSPVLALLVAGLIVLAGGLWLKAWGGK